MKCKNCGAEAREYREDHTCGWMCDACGWAIATSYFEPYETDHTKYSVIIFHNEANSEKIKVISKITGENYLASKNRLLLQESVVFEGQAIEIMNVRKQLSDSNITFKIKPDFPY